MTLAEYRKTLVGAATLLRQRGRSQSKYENVETGEVCLVGALARSFEKVTGDELLILHDGYWMLDDENHDFQHCVLENVEESLPDEHRDSSDPLAALTDFSDMHATDRQALTLLARAAKVAPHADNITL